jgi:hypothetical protein
VPVGVVHAPKPKTRCDVSEFVCHISHRIKTPCIVTLEEHAWEPAQTIRQARYE